MFLGRLLTKGVSVWEDGADGDDITGVQPVWR